MKIEFEKALKQFGKNKAIVVFGIVALICIVLLSDSFSEKKSVKTEYESKMTDISSYADSLEEKLTDFIGKIKGVGECEVMVSFLSGVEVQYAVEESVLEKAVETVAGKSDESLEKRMNYLIVSNGDGEYPIVIKEILPEIGGVLIICDGGDSLTVRSRVSEAVSTLLSISSNRVYVVGKS